jgi:hypothetical protein
VGEVRQTYRVGIEIRFVDGQYLLTAGPPNSPEDHSDTVETSFMAVIRLTAWGCHITDISDALDATGRDWRQEYDTARVKLRESVAEWERDQVRYADRLGVQANEDNAWFDKEVELWKSPDGTRLIALELSDLGRQVVAWIRIDRMDIVQGIFHEMEEAMLDGVVESTTARDMGLELLEGLQAGLIEFMQDDADAAGTANADIRRMMGDETKQLWIPMWTETLDFLRRNGDL